jgi:hypothetical protein
MLLIKTSSGVIEKYPYTEFDLRADFPQTSFPDDITNADLSDFGVFKVAEVDAPVADYTKVVVEGAPVNVGDNWTQVWIVRDATNAEESAALDVIEAEYESAIQAHLDSTAQSRGYDSMISACSYASGTHPKFSVEGQDCLAWRSAVWDAAYQIMQDVRSGARPLPTLQQVMSELPPMVWSI